MQSYPHFLLCLLLLYLNIFILIKYNKAKTKKIIKENWKIEESFSRILLIFKFFGRIEGSEDFPQ